MIDKCECRGSGFCQRFQRHMSAGQQAECARNPSFRERLTGIPLPRHISPEELEEKRQRRDEAIKARTPQVALPCIYRSDNPVEWAGCGCHVFDCDIHERCIPWRKSKTKPGIKVCLECSDRKATPNIEPEKITRHLLYHIYPISGNGAWQANVSQLCERLRIFNGKKIVAIVRDPKEGRKPDPDGPHAPDKGRYFAPCDSADDVKRAFGQWADGIEFMEFENDPSLREGVTLVPMLERLPNGPNDVTLYAQAKGTTRHPHHIANHWAWTLYILYFDYWPLVAEQLKTFACTGAFKKLGPGWSATQSRSDWHYSGSFFWLRNAELFTRDWRRMDRFWSCIEPYPSQHFDCKEAGCLFHEGPNDVMKLYRARYWHKTVNPEFAQWRKDNVKWFNAMWGI